MAAAGFLPDFLSSFFFAGQEKGCALELNLRRINPDLDIEAVNTKIEKENVKELFKDCSVVAECFDKAEQKSMLVTELLRLNKFVVSASGLGGCGSSDDIRVHKMKNGFVVIGDMESDICSKPALSPRVNVAAAKQADIILEHILSK